MDGTMEARGGTLDVQSSTGGTGTLLIDAGATMPIDGKAVTLPKVDFAGATGTLCLAKGATVTSETEGVAAGDTIETTGITGVNWNAATDLLTLIGSGHTVDRLHFNGSFASASSASPSRTAWA